MTLRHRARARRTHALKSDPRRWYYVVLYRSVLSNAPYKDVHGRPMYVAGCNVIHGPMTRTAAEKELGNERHYGPWATAWAIAWTGIGRNAFTLHRRAVEKQELLNALES